MTSPTPSEYDAFVKKIGLNIKRYRQEKKFTQIELAKNLGITHIAISQIERGTIGPSLHTLYKLSIILDTPVSKLLADQDVIILNKDFFLDRIVKEG